MYKLKGVAIDSDFFGKERLTEIEAVLRVLRHVRFIYCYGGDNSKFEYYSLDRLLRVPKNFELLRRKLCEEEEEVVDEEEHTDVERIDLVSLSDVVDAILQDK